jgi:predicted nucleic acid-binding Zn ribbon protein
MHCVHCGNEIPETHGFCSKCGKQAGATKPAVRSGYVVALLVVFFVGVGLIVYFIRADKAATNMQPNTSPQPKLYSETIDTAFTVPQLRDKAYRFAIPAGARDAMLQGHFTATGGANNDIEVWVTNNDGFVNWENKHPVTPIYSSGRVTQGALSVFLPPEAGAYYLIFNNRFSFISPKAVQDDVRLQYKR